MSPSEEKPKVEMSPEAWQESLEIRAMQFDSKTVKPLVWILMAAIVLIFWE